MTKFSNSSKKRCREFFNYPKGIGKNINIASSLIEKENVNTIIAEFIDDYDNIQLYNVLLYLIRENFPNNITDTLKNFQYIK